MKRIEQDMQMAVIAHLRLRAKPGVLYWHTPQGAWYGSPAQGKIMKALGTLAGVSDLLLMHIGKFYAIELKAPGEKPTQDQLNFLKSFWENGGHAEYVDNIDNAIALLENWGLLRGKAQ